MNQLIFTDLGMVVGLGSDVTESMMRDIGALVRAWAEHETKVLILPIAQWEILDKRTGNPS